MLHGAVTILENFLWSPLRHDTIDADPLCRATSCPSRWPKWASRQERDSFSTSTVKKCTDSCCLKEQSIPTIPFSTLTLSLCTMCMSRSSMAMNRITAPLLPALYDTNVLTFCVEIHGLESTNQYSDPFEAYYFLIYECMR